MATFVLVHSPVVGPAVWRGVAAGLRADAHPVVVPALTPPSELAPPYLPVAVVEVVAAVRGSGHGGDNSVVLCGYSGAGPRLPAFGRALARAGFPVSAYVFVDAGIPFDGRKPRDANPGFGGLIDSLRGPDGRLPKWSQWWGADVMAELLPDPDVREPIEAELRPIPADLFDEPVPVPASWPEAPCAYLYFSYDDEANEAERLGWPVTRLPGSHLQLVTEAAAVAAALVDLVTRATGAPRTPPAAPNPS